MVAGELIRSEVEVRTGRCETFAEAADAMAHRRLDVIEVAERLGYALAAAGTHPFARWQDQEVIDTQHYHLVESTLRYVAWRNNTFGIHVHTGIRGADRAVAVSSALRSVLPELLAASCQLAVARGSTHPPALHPHPGVHEVLPALRDPRLAGGVGRVRRVRALPHRRRDRSGSTPRSGGASARIRRSRPSRCGSATHSRSSPGRSALAGLMTALTAHYARMYDEGRPLPAHPHRLIEENFWRAIRWGMAGELIDLDSGAVMPAGARIEALVEEVSEVASELGIAPHLAPLREPSAAEVYAARLEEGESVREVWPQVVARTRESVVEWLAVREGETR